MSSLYKRANPRQAKLLRMIEGACRNAAHAHPGHPLDNRLARGIAKRAAGTISAAWSDVLATPRAWSEDVPVKGSRQAVAIGGQLRPASGGRASAPCNGRAPGSPKAILRHIHRAIGNAVGPARAAGELERAAALIDVLRLIAGEIEQPTPLNQKLRLGADV